MHVPNVEYLALGDIFDGMTLLAYFFFLEKKILASFKMGWFP